ncbi:WbqC family protein [Aliiglaciecola litoralis]|uniref:WbqC family protein n=1 Tax=Aliiglaciecola litoralis TaxID=582857 RepID=A0ABN1LJC5_9ALTE
MNLVIMQPYFFPYVGYFSLFDAADTFVIYDDVNFIKKGWVNRNNFYSKSGPQRFTLPISKASQNSKISDLSILSLHHSKIKFLRMLSFSYSKAPYYQDVISLLVDIFDYKTELLADFLVNALIKVNEYLNISVEIIRSSQEQFAKGLAGEQRIVSIAKNLQAEKYINAIGGVDLYSTKSFEMQGIKLQFLKHKGTNYRQFSDVHTPYLSIVDVLMFNSPSEAMQIIQSYELING